MKRKVAVFAVLVVFLAITSISQAVETWDIDKVRNKKVLDNKDLEIIDDFVAEAVAELVASGDFVSVAKTRIAILVRKNANITGEQGQYIEQFSDSAYKHISKAFEQVSALTDEDQKFKAILNLLILADGLEDVRLANLALEKLNDENIVIRYWAVHAVTNAGITKQLNSNDRANSKLAEEIVERLEGIVDRASPEILALAAEFAAKVKIRRGDDLLLLIADTRIKKYADWTVEYERLDGDILGLLCGKISAGEYKPAFARSFAQLYSYAIQRYIKGRDVLSETQKQQLASVLVETERSCIGIELGIIQSTIKKAIEDGNYDWLLSEHNELLGEQTKAGKLSLKLNFNYGGGADSNKSIGPLVLADPPALKKY